MVTRESFKAFSPGGPIWPCCSQKLLDAGCSVLNTYFTPRIPIDSSQIVAGAGCSLLLEAVTRMVCDPGETIITPAPYWPMFSLLLAKAEVVVYVIPAVTQESENALNPVDIDTLLNWSEETQKTWESHLRELEGRPRGRPKALLLSNPQNPLGRCYSKGYLEGALRFCQKVSHIMKGICSVLTEDDIKV